MRVLTVVCIAALALAACDKKKEGGAEGAKGEGEGKAAEVAVYDGPLSGKLLEDAKKLVKPFMPFDEAMNALKGKAGEPTKVDGATYYWAVVEGEKCTELSVEKTDKAEVGMTGVSTIDKMMKSMYAKCADRAGAKAEDEAKPAEGEAKPADGEAKPTEGEAKPAEDEAKPAEGEAKPTEGEAKPAEGEAKPAEGEAKPAEGEAKPAEGEAKPTEGEAKPAEGEAKPAEKTE